MSQCRSTPGHLIHLMVRGRYALTIAERQYEVSAGDVIYYHESETVIYRGGRSRVEFVSIGFLASDLQPPPIHARVMKSTAVVRAAFGRVVEASMMPAGATRRLTMHRWLTTICDEIAHRHPQPMWGASETAGELWWSAEQIIRRTRRYRIGLEALAEAVRCSRATLVRSCRRCVGQSPMARVRELRMDQAAGLLRLGELSVSAVAEYLGYGRVHEFSREFGAYFGYRPSRILGQRWIV